MSRNIPLLPLGMHYAKCQEGLGRPPIAHVTTWTSNCPCYHIRGNMKALKEKYFNESPMSLQLLAACAVTIDQIMNPHPHREEILRMKYSAARIQRRWKTFLYSRGPRYRTSLCRYYMSERGCRNGVNCTFAHGNHDVRHSFRPPSNFQGLHGRIESANRRNGKRNLQDMIQFISDPWERKRRA